jgi:purine nucleosidase
MQQLIRIALLVVLWLPTTAIEADPAVPVKIPIILDTDIGDDIDDALALALVLTSPELDLRGVTTVAGDSFTRALIVCRLLHGVGRSDVPVAAGTPPKEVPVYRGQMQYGLRPAFRKRPDKDLAVDFLYRQLKARPGELTLLAVGPLTNLAELVTKHPDCKPWIKRIVVMGGAIRVGYGNKPPPEPEWNIKSDVKAAQVVFASGIPLVVAPLDATARLKLDPWQRPRVLGAGTPLANQLHALYQLWDKTEPILFDPAAVALCFSERHFTMEDLAVQVDDKGMTRTVKAKPNARVATAVKRDEFLKWYVERVAPADRVTLPKLKATNPANLVERGKMPSRVHVIEDYETDIERRWWLAGRLETKNVPPGSRRACRGVLTNDFDDRMGDPKAMYTAVIFNPVPGPPMGKNTRLGFRYWLKGTDTLRVQLYTLSKGYHRHLTLSRLPQGSWQTATVDMTTARRPDGSGEPLSEDERIDDIQFYTEAEAELLIDDIVLYDAAPAEAMQPFPKRLVFTAWFDTGRQGKEWPGDFEIVSKKAPHTWKAARAVPRSEKERWVRLSLRGARPLGERTWLRFRYHLTGADSVGVVFVNRSTRLERSLSALGLKNGEWDEHTVELVSRPAWSADEVRFLVPAGAELLLDDVLLFEPGVATNR